MENEYTIKQLAEALGKTRQAVQKQASREAWAASSRKARGGGKVYPLTSLPEPVREAVLAMELRASEPETMPVPVVSTPPAVPETDTSQLSTKQRNVMCARLAFVREIDRLTSAGMSKTMVLDNLVRASGSGGLADHLMPLVTVANDRANGTRGLSKRTLQRWCSQFAKHGEAALAPARTTKDMGIPHWVGAFLAKYQVPAKPSLTDAYRQAFGLPHKPNPGAPSIHQVRRFMKKLSVPAREQGRRTGNKMLSLLPHRKRDTKDMWPTDVYTMDGTTFDAEILHPHTGQPFKPEITLVIDVATRRCVGMSVALAESAIATLDGVRMACLFGGIPAILHADNGPGYKNAIWTAEGTGLMARLGIELRNSIPGRPQGKGIMERAVGTICVRAAKRLKSCTHADMDGDAAHKVFKLSRKALKKGTNILPVWEDFRKTLLQVVEEYNDSPHSNLPRFIDPETGKRRNMSPNEAWQAGIDKGFEPVTVPDHMKEELFMPAENRKVRRGYVQFFGQKYAHAELADLEGELVEVRYNVWDSSQVYIWSTEGRRICTAKLDGHAQPYFPPSQMEVAKMRREKAQIGRLEDKIQRIAPGATVVLPEPESALDAFSDVPAVGPAGKAASETVIDVQPVVEDPNKRPLFLNAMHHYRWLMEHRDQCTDADEAWLADYAETAEYIDMEDRYRFEGIAYGVVPQAAEAN